MKISAALSSSLVVLFLEFQVEAFAQSASVKRTTSLRCITSRERNGWNLARRQIILRISGIKRLFLPPVERAYRVE